jgi:hypothetical protein
LVSAGVVSLTFGTITAHSQSAPTPAIALVTPSGTELAAIVVTANKRVENIDRVDLTITAISGAALAGRRIVSLSDVAAAVPGLTYAPSADLANVTSNNDAITGLAGIPPRLE